MADWMMKWDPRDELEELKHKMNELMKSAPFHGKRLMKEMGKGEWYPALDMKETEAEIIVTVELAGLSESDVTVKATETALELKGERKEIKEVEDKKAGYLKRERSFGKFSRLITLPKPIKPNKVEATFKNGVLKVVLPKAGEPKKIKGYSVKIKKEKGKKEGK